MLLITRLDVLDDDYYALAFENLMEFKESIPNQSNLWAISYETEKAIPVTLVIYEPTDKGFNILFTSGNTGMNSDKDINEGFKIIKENLSRNNQEITYVGAIK